MVGQTTQMQFAVDTAAKPKLLDRVRAAARVRHMALGTEKAHVHWIRRFILFHDKRHPSEMDKQEVSDFLTHLAVDRKVASSKQNQALAALLFLYRVVLEQNFGWLDDVVRAKRPLRISVVFTHQEAMAVLANLDGVYWLIGKLLYGSGLRVMECNESSWTVTSHVTFGFGHSSGETSTNALPASTAVHFAIHENKMPARRGGDGR